MSEVFTVIPETCEAAAVKLIGVGEGINDLKPFVPGEFAEALLE